MPTFPRGLLHADGRSLSPMTVTWPDSPGPLINLGDSGKPQVRGTTQRGFTWTETYDLLSLSDPAARGLLADIRAWRRDGVTLDVAHPDIVLLGAGGGTPRINGAAQAGTTLNLDGFPAGTLVLRKGDFIRPTGKAGAHEVTADATTDVGGAVAVSITPPIFVGGSPDDNDIVILADVGVPFFKAFIQQDQKPRSESKRANLASGVSITFREVL